MTNQRPPVQGDYLGPRERQVLAGMARGQSNAEIARELCLSVDTIKTHARRMFIKLGVSTRIDAVAAGRRMGLVGGRCPMCGHGSASAGRTGVRVGTETTVRLPSRPECAGGLR